jgi:hypothetical protein
MMYGNYNNNNNPSVPAAGAPAINSYAAPASAGYDLNAYFGSMSLQNNPNPGQSAAPPMAYSQQQFQNYPSTRHYDQNQQPSAHQQVGGNGFMSPINGQQPGPYPYNTMPSPSYGSAVPGGAQQVHQQNAFGMQPFNPQSQSFVPRTAPPMLGGQQMQPMPSQVYGGYSQPYRPAAPVSAHPPTMPRPNPNIFGGYGPPRSNNPIQAPTVARSANGPGNATNTNRSNSPAVNQPSLAEMSAKWGKPASLPAKPPTPVTSEPVMFNQINKTLLNAGLMDPIAAPGAHRTAAAQAGIVPQTPGSLPSPAESGIEKGLSPSSNSGQRDDAAA